MSSETYQDGSSAEFKVSRPVKIGSPPFVQSSYSLLPSSPTPGPNEKYPDYRRTPAEIIFKATVEMPHLVAIADRKLPGRLREEKQVLTRELAYAVKAVEEHPDDLLAQRNTLRGFGVSDEKVLDHVASIMPVLQDERARVYAEVDNRSYSQNKRLAKRARRRIEHRLGNGMSDLLPEDAGLPLEMIKDLAYYNEAVKLFERDVFDRHPELRKGRFGKDSEHRQDAVTAHVNGLLAVFINAQPGLPNIDVPAVYAEQFAELQDELAGKRQMIEEDAAGWTLSQQHREIRKAVKNFASLDENTSVVKENSGLTEDMEKEASRALVKESLLTAAWSGGVEVSQLGQGATGNVFNFGPQLLHTNNPWIVGGAAVGSRITSIGLLGLKGILAKNLTRLTGVAPDLGTKIADEVSEKPLTGFAGWNGAIEGGFALWSGLGAVHGGWDGAASTELGTNLGPMGIPRQIVEDALMYLKIRSIKRKQNDIRDAQRETMVPELVVDLEVPSITPVDIDTKEV